MIFVILGLFHNADECSSVHSNVWFSFMNGFGLLCRASVWFQMMSPLLDESGNQDIQASLLYRGKKLNVLSIL